LIERASEIERYVCAMIQQAFMLFDGMMVVKMKMKKEWIGGCEQEQAEEENDRQRGRR